MHSRLRIAPLALVAALGCGGHLHRPQDAAASDGAAGDLKAARLIEGFAEEFLQSRSMLQDELDAAQAWARVGRDRDLLDILGATAKDELDPETEILLAPRCRGRFKADGWATFCSKLSRRLSDLSGFTLPIADPSAPAAPASPPATPPRGRRPAALEAPPARDTTQELLAAVRGLQRHWKGPSSGETLLARAASEYELTARALRLPPESAPPPRCPTLDLPGRAPGLQASFDRVRGLCLDRRASLGAVAERAACRGGAQAGCAPSELGAQADRLIALHDALAAHHEELARRISAYLDARRACAGSPDAVALPVAAELAAASGSAAPGSKDMSTRTGSSGQPGRCDDDAVRRTFAALGELAPPPALVQHDLQPLARGGRLYQLGEQLLAVEALIAAQQARAGKSEDAAARKDPAAGAPPIARTLHATIEGIDRVQKVVDALEVAVLALIRETLRVERDALIEAQGYADRRLRIERAKLAAQLDELVLLLEGYAGLERLERSGCAAQGVVAAQEAPKCRDDLSRALVAYSNAWTLGRAAQRQADVHDLGARHEASIARSRAAMAAREVYLVAGITELVKFNKGGFSPEALAQIVVSAVGFAVLAGGVYAP